MMALLCPMAPLCPTARQCLKFQLSDEMLYALHSGKGCAALPHTVPCQILANSQRLGAILR